MKYNDGANLDPSQIGGGGGARGSRGKIAIGGGAGLLVVIVALFFGIDPSGLIGPSDSGSGSVDSPSRFEQCRTGADISNNRECRFVAFTNSIQSYWKQALSGYRTIQVQTFSGGVATACGNATSAVGPFYCGGDTTVYLDTGFFDELTGTLGAKGGDAAEAYVLAHEFGHHIQQQTGTMRQVQSQGQQTGPTSPGVRLELQADCYAGVWFAHATQDPNSPIAEVTQEDLSNALDAAAAVGDDRIQQKMQGQVRPESWTHGSAANRQKWLLKGFHTGDPNQCDTFAPDAV